MTEIQTAKSGKVFALLMSSDDLDCLTELALHSKASINDVVVTSFETGLRSLTDVMLNADYR